MSIFEAIRVAFTALRANKLRSLLTMLGIIIGVGAVIGMLAIGAGFQAFLDQQFSNFGVGVFYVGPFVDTRRVDIQQSAQLTAADAAAILQSGAAPAVKTVVAEYSINATVSAAGERQSYAVRAVTPGHFSIMANTLRAGRYYTEEDERNQARVAVIGPEVAEQLFGYTTSAVGERITINGVRFEVIGIIVRSRAAAGRVAIPTARCLCPIRPGAVACSATRFLPALMFIVSPYRPASATRSMRRSAR
jgi:ABC-type antimicrobial peptide transport system, permease component